MGGICEVYNSAVTIEVFIGKPVGRVGILYVYENGVGKKSKG